MINFERVQEISFNELVELLIPYLSGIDADLVIIGNRIQLTPSSVPFLLALNKTKKRLGIIDVLNEWKEFPDQLLSHASWVAQNSYAIANLNKTDFNPDFAPFVIGLTPSFPPWLNLLSYINLDIRLLKYTAISYQGTSVLIFDSLFESANPEIKKQTPSSLSQAMVESPARTFPELALKENSSSVSPSFHYEGFYEAGLTGLTEEEIRYFSK
ncbi:MAG: hypothetical protein ACHQYP_03610 [Nitrospiria bacterium]